MRQNRMVRIALCGLLLLLGCANEPGALRLEVIPEKPQFRPDEPICLQATLRAVKGPVCLGRGYRFGVEMTPVTAEAPVLREQRFALCGMPALATLPLRPFLLTAILLDVGDLLGRFNVLHQNDQAKSSVTLQLIHDAKKPGLLVLRDAASIGQSKGKLPPGRYRLKVSLLNEHQDWYPPPLFWRPYAHPATAEVLVCVAD